MTVDDQSNEIPAVPKLLHLLELSRATVTRDAMHCQVETAQAILDAQADYLLIVKGNQEGLHGFWVDQFVEYGEADYQVQGLRQHVTVEKSHGRRERREYYVIQAPAGHPALRRWPGVRSIGMVYRCREEGEDVHEETIFFISSQGTSVYAATGGESGGVRREIIL
jgi:hypothetical protein